MNKSRRDFIKRVAEASAAVSFISILPAFTAVTGSTGANGDSVFKDSTGWESKLHPELDKLPSMPFLPNPLILRKGEKDIPITTTGQWLKKRNWIKMQYQHWISGSVPPSPKTFQSKTLSKSSENGVKVQMVELRFGPDMKAKMTVEMMIPPSGKSLPVFMTQWNHRDWAQVAVRRGYIGCVYAGADEKDDTDNYSGICPGYDFATLMKRAWGASRVVDYLYTLPGVNTDQIALTGHSRNGKQSLMAAAFDDRIKAVVSSSGGTGGESTFRWSDDRFTPGSFDRMVDGHPDWFCERLSWFIGREQKLPVDQNSLMALVAPRGLMMVSAITEYEGNPWGVEQSYKSVKEVYHFLGAESALAILLRRGRHQHARRDVERYLDFFDHIFERSSIPPKNKLYYDYSFEKWKRLSGERMDPLKFPVADRGSSLYLVNKRSFSDLQDRVRKNIGWLLGDIPPGVSVKKTFSSSINGNRDYEDDYLSEVIGQLALPDTIREMKFGPYSSLGDDLWGTIYFPPGSVNQGSVPAKLPLVIYLHNYDYSIGYRNQQRNPSLIEKFTRKGFAVLMFDMVGFGTRVQEARHFYDRYPHWSEMGNMVTDVRSIVRDASQRMPFIDSQNIFLAGYSLGGTVALFTAALDKYVKGVAVVSAFSSFRHDNTATEGIRHYCYLHGLLPRLGFFRGHEDRIPVDFDDILACIAPRPLLVIAPAQDREHTIKRVQEMVSAGSEVYRNMQVADRLDFEQPDTYNHFTVAMQEQIATWLYKQRIRQAN